MKLKSIFQQIKCPHCRYSAGVLEHKRVLNFTEVETTLYCKNCHARLGKLPFSEWNTLQRDRFEKPEIAAREAERQSPDRNRNRNRNRNRRRRR